MIRYEIEKLLISGELGVDELPDFWDDMYEKYRHVLVEVMRLINPTLSDAQLHRLALFISCSIEGHTMFIGNGKRWTYETENIVAMAAKSFLWLVQSVEVPE